MVLGWRRAFCTSIPRERDSAAHKEKQEKSSSSSSSTPRLGSKFGIFSNPSTPRLQSQQVSSPSFRCGTTATVPAQSMPESPKLRGKTKNSPRLFQGSNPSSPRPRSPSTFSLLKASLRLSKSRCGICMQSVKTGQGMAIFTAECSHSFHFPCIAAHVNKQDSLICPVCSSTWNEMPILSFHNQKPVIEERKTTVDAMTKKETKQQNLRPILKAYNDDEPLMSPNSGARFNPIPESDENDEGENDSAVEEFQGFFVNVNTSPLMELKINSTNVEVSLMPDAAVISVGRSSETYAIVLKVRAPPATAKAACRAPIDLVTVLDVSGSMTTEKLQMMKRAMRLIVSSLSADDRLSIVAFSATSKRVLPLRRMSTNGRQSARRIVDALAMLPGTKNARDALKKAAKVLEDRRERNPVASILLLSDDGQDEQSPTTANSVIQKRLSSFVSSTRCAHLEIPVHSIGFTGMNGQPTSEDSLAKCVKGVLSVVVQDLRLQLDFVSCSAPAGIAAVYSYTGGLPVGLGSGSIRLGDLYAEEQRELLVELKVPSSAVGAHHVLSVRFSYKDPSTQELIHSKEQALLVPRPHTVRSSAPGIERLRSLFVSTRAVAESRRLLDRNDLTGAYYMLTSARALLLQSGSGSGSSSTQEFVRSLEGELSELHRRRQSQTQQNQRPRANVGREVRLPLSFVDEKGEPLTPTSAWRAAERLAKVAIMRKSLNRVSDLHGFENARF